MTPLDAMKQALSDIEDWNIEGELSETLANLRTAIAEMEKADPVAWGILINDNICTSFINKQDAEFEFDSRNKLYPTVVRQLLPLFTHPTQSRDSIIEECAAVCMRECSVMEEPHEFERCAAAIRALKGK